MPIKHEIEFHKVKKSGFRAPELTAVIALTALGILLWGCLSLAPMALLALTLFAVVPILSVLAACLAERDGEVRHHLSMLAAFSLTMGLPLAWLHQDEFSDVGRQAERIRRATPVAEAITDRTLAESKFGQPTIEQLRKLSDDDRRRAGVQLARFGKWSLAQQAWKSTVTTYTQQSEMRVSSYLKSIGERGVSKASLLPLCQSIHASGFKQQSVLLWRTYYPKDVPQNWKQPFQEFPQ